MKLYTLLLSLCCFASQAYAADSQLVHQPSDTLNMPPAGEELKLRVFLTHTKRIDLPVFANVVRDGQMLQLPLTGKLDDYERAIYSATIPAPLADLAYQFLYLPEGESATHIVSPRYASRRNCRYSTVPVSNDVPDTSNAAGRAELTQRAQMLEGEVNVLGAVNGLLAKLHAEVSDE